MPIETPSDVVLALQQIRKSQRATEQAVSHSNKMIARSNELIAQSREALGKADEILDKTNAHFST